MSFVRALSCLAFAFGSLASLACSGSHEPGLELRVASLPVGAPESRVLTTDLGYELELESAFWTSAEFGISACPSALRRAWDLVVPSALAHGTATSTRLATPTVQSAFDGEVELGVLAPPADRYCSATLLVAPADDDARGLEESPEMLGMAVAVKGSFRAAGSDEAVPFEVASSVPVTVSAELELELDAQHRTARVRVEHSIPRWFDGIDFAVLDAAALETSFMANVAAAATIHAE